MVHGDRSKGPPVRSHAPAKNHVVQTKTDRGGNHQEQNDPEHDSPQSFAKVHLGPWHNAELYGQFTAPFRFSTFLAACPTSPIDNSRSDRQTTAFAGNRFWRALRAVFRH